MMTCWLRICVEAAPERYEDFCELLAAIHGDECRRHDKDVRLGRAVASLVPNPR